MGNVLVRSMWPSSAVLASGCDARIVRCRRWSALTKLVSLDLRDNKVSGELPSSLGSELGSTSGLASVVVSDSQPGHRRPRPHAAPHVWWWQEPGEFCTTLLCCVGGVMGPEWMHAPEWLLNLFPRCCVQSLDVSSNQLSGTVPATWAGLTTLDGLSLANNPDMCSVRTLVWAEPHVVLTLLGTLQDACGCSKAEGPIPATG